jgi:quercetin dioxygenase-like cupin family protein
MVDHRCMTDTTSLPQPTQLDRQAIVHLPPNLDIGVLHVDDSYWSHASQQQELAEGRILSVFDYDSTWSWWERHPTGDELVYVVSGEIDLHLDDGVTTSVQRVQTGESAIVPRGAWHRAVVPVRSRVLFVTPTPARTEHRPA